MIFSLLYFNYDKHFEKIFHKTQTSFFLKNLKSCRSSQKLHKCQSLVIFYRSFFQYQRSNNPDYDISIRIVSFRIQPSSDASHQISRKWSRARRWIFDMFTGWHGASRSPILKQIHRLFVLIAGIPPLTPAGVLRFESMLGAWTLIIS